MLLLVTEPCFQPRRSNTQRDHEKRNLSFDINLSPLVLNTLEERSLRLIPALLRASHEKNSKLQ